MSSFSLLALVCVLLQWQSAVSQPAGDLISNLPGITWSTAYKQYSGYLDIPNNGHHIHYWFVESMNNPATDPVVLWLNGGPGCSSMDGLLYEHGPFHVYNTNGQPNLYNNEENSWNNMASVIYFESPICVGYSYSDDGKCVMSDNTTAADNYQALLQFFTAKFPMYQQNDFFILGESYAGNYVPLLSYTVLDNKPNVINLKGFSVGDPVGFGSDWSNSRVWYNYFHGFLGESTWNELMTECCVPGKPYTRQNCAFNDPPNARCAQLVAKSSLSDTGVNEYDWLIDCHSHRNATLSKTEIVFDEYYRALKILYSAENEKLKKKFGDEFNLYEKYVTEDKEDGHGHGFGSEVEVACINSHGAYVYMNLKAVQDAIHVQNDIEWNICSNSLHYESMSMYSDMSFLYKDMLAMDPQFYIMVYNGDVDPGINSLGSQWFVDDLQRPMLQNYGWREWFLHGDSGTQVGGWTINFERVSFVSVRGAGHMVPQFTPAAALKMFNYFIQNKPLD